MNYTIDTLIPFDMVIDIDFGLLKLISFEYNHDIFYKGFFKCTDEEIQWYLTTRSSENPLDIFTKPGSDTLDLYNQFIDQEYEKILQLSPPTSLFNLLKSASKVDGDVVRFTVLCKNEQEKHLFETRNGKAHSIIVENDISNIDISGYGNIYVKNYKDILQYKKLEGKNIFIGNYPFNMEIIDNEKVPLIDISKSIIKENVIKVIDIYAIPENKIPLG